MLIFRWYGLFCFISLDNMDFFVIYKLFIITFITDCYVTQQFNHTNSQDLDNLREDNYTSLLNETGHSDFKVSNSVNITSLLNTHSSSVPKKGVLNQESIISKPHPRKGVSTQEQVDQKSVPRKGAILDHTEVSPIIRVGSVPKKGVPNEEILKQKSQPRKGVVDTSNFAEIQQKSEPINIVNTSKFLSITNSTKTNLYTENQTNNIVNATNLTYNTQNMDDGYIPVVIAVVFGLGFLLALVLFSYKKLQEYLNYRQYRQVDRDFLIDGMYK